MGSYSATHRLTVVQGTDALKVVVVHPTTGQAGANLFSFTAVVKDSSGRTVGTTTTDLLYATGIAHVLVPDVSAGDYTAKAGLAGFTRALAHDLAPDGITANCVSPGMMDTRRQTTSAPGEPSHHATRQTLVGRRGLPDECAVAVRWLAGPGGRFVTGQTIHVNGGAYLGG